MISSSLMTGEKMRRNSRRESKKSRVIEMQDEARRKYIDDLKKQRDDAIERRKHIVEDKKLNRNAKIEKIKTDLAEAHPRTYSLIMETGDCLSFLNEKYEPKKKEKKSKLKFGSFMGYKDPFGR